MRILLSAPNAAFLDHSEVLGRVFHADRHRGLKDRIVVYRLPIVLRSHDDVPRTLRRVLVERISRVLAIPPDELEEELR